MIRKLRIKFVVLSMVSLLALLALILTGMNIINYRTVVSDADELLNILSVNKGDFPDMTPPPEGHGMGGFGGFGDRFSPETPHESRYFSVLLNEDGTVVLTETGRITAVDSAQAMDYAARALREKQDKGFLEHFRYRKVTEGSLIRMTFLDCGRTLDSFYNFLFAGIFMALAGYLVVFCVILFVSGRLLRPIAESYEKQKRFITDAGHEIKTPLAIINANAEVLEMELGSNECVRDIRQQTRRLAELTNDLVYLARMEEAETPMLLFPLSDVVTETAASFRGLAQNKEQDFTCQIQSMLSLWGNAKAIRQLVCLLLDNAVKYSPEGGSIRLLLEKQGRWLQLSVMNSTEKPVDPESLSRLFDRFYRGDPSRNSQTGGYGIGLSVAQAIVNAHGGKIQAFADGEKLFRVTVQLPAQKNG